MTDSDKPHAVAPAKIGRRVPPWLAWPLLAVVLVAAIALVPWHEAGVAVAHASKLWILAALGLSLVGTPIIAAQWRLFLPRQYHVPGTRVFEILALSLMSRSSLPFLAGHASSVGLLVMRGGVGPGAAVLVMTLDQLYAGIAKVGMVAATLAFASLPPVLATAGATLMALVAVWLGAMLAAARWGHSLHAVAGQFPERAEKLIRRLADLTAHLELLRHPVRAAGALLLSALKKLTEIGATLAVQHAVGIDLSVWNTLLVVTAVDLATVIPGLPAGLGVYEAAMLFSYHYLGVPAGHAFAAAVLRHAVLLATDFGYGYAVLVAEPGWRRRAKSPSISPAAETETAD